jgi:alkanesulfonate monooxygenase SsuD/methylene tetrahydromethanopterin reductase-like flavin-dependent oxidoreductase (luciferase family)
MARLGVGIMIIAQKPWEAALAELAEYRRLYRDVNASEPPRPLLPSFVAVHESEEGAREMYERYIMSYCASTLEHYEFADAGLADLQVFGTPAQVAEQMIEHQRMLQSTGVIGVFSYGGMPDEVAKANLRLFSEQVLPRLHAHEPGLTLSSST